MNRQLALLFIVTAAPVQSAQVASALLREGDVLPSGQSVDDLALPSVSEAGGFAVLATNVIAGSGNITTIWGSLDQGPPSALRTETTIGSFEQQAFTSMAISRTEVAYAALSVNASNGGSLERGLWVDDEVLLVTGMPAPEAPRTWFEFEQVGTTTGGELSFIGRTLPPMGTGVVNGLYFGLGTPALLFGGDSVPGVPVPLSDNGPLEYAFSANGNRQLVHVELTGSSDVSLAMLLDGAGLNLGGSLVRRGQAIPPSIGGEPGESWGPFSHLGINESGSYHFVSGFNLPFATNNVIIIDGMVHARAGDIIDGVVLTGRVWSMAMNELGDHAFVWDTFSSSPSGTLFMNDKAVLHKGDPVDWDGDGIPDAGATLAAFPETGELLIGPDRALYMLATVDVNGTLLEGLLRIDFDAGMSYCASTLNSTGKAGILSASGSVQTVDNDVALFASQMPTDQFGLFVNSLTQDFVPAAGGSQGNLCLGGAIGRYADQVFSTGATGTGILPLDLSATPTPNGTVAILAGQTWNFQAWYRDSNPGPTSNFTDGVSVSFQ